MEIYDKDGNHIGDLFDSDDEGGSILIYIGIALVCAFPVLLTKFFGLYGYAVATSLMYGAWIYFWVRVVIPEIMHKRDSTFVGVLENIIWGILIIPLGVIGVLLISELSCGMILDITPVFDNPI